MKIIKEAKGYGAFTYHNDDYIGTYASSFEDLKNNIIEVLNLHFEDENLSFYIEDIDFEYDLESFLNYYRIIGSDEFANMLNIDKEKIDSYKSGKEKPSPDEARKIIDAARQAGRELADIPEF